MGLTTAIHVFADRGVESEVLTDYFDTVYRIGIDPRNENESIPIEADVADFVDDPTQYGFDDDVTFDFALLHPPCTKWSQMTSISGDADDHENLIPLAREFAEKFADEWVIENKPNAPLNDPTVLSGKMFGLPIVYKRGFEASYELSEPPSETDEETDISPYFSADRTREWWFVVKGYPVNRYGKQHMAKNALPASYVQWLLRNYYESTIDTGPARATHDDPAPEVPPDSL